MKKGTYSWVYMIPIVTWTRHTLSLLVHCIYVFNLDILNGGEWFTLRSSRFTPCTETWCNWARGCEAVEPVCRFCRRGKSLALTEIQTLDYPARSLTAVPIMLKELHVICWVRSLFGWTGKKCFLNIEKKNPSLMIEQILPRYESPLCYLTRKHTMCCLRWVGLQSLIEDIPMYWSSILTF